MRFHIGLSFRWKTIKKFLLPFLVGFLAYFGFNNLLGGFDLGFIQTYAYQSNTSSYDVYTYNYNDMLDSTGCHDVSLLDYFQYLISHVDWSTSYYQVFATLPQYGNVSLDYDDYYIYLYLIPTSQIQNDYLLYRGTNSANQVGMSYQYGFNISPYYNTYSYYIRLRKNYGSHYQHCAISSSDYQNDLTTINIINFIQNNVNDNNHIANDWAYLYHNSNSTYASFFEQSQNSITNTSSYNTTLWYYYSSFRYRYIPTDMSSNTFWYYKNINLVNENKSYSAGDYFDSYYDLHIPYNTNNVGYQSSLNSFYTNILASDISNYYLKLRFDVLPVFNTITGSTTDYLNNTSFEYICSGRTSNNGYYTYTNFPCSLSSTSFTSGTTIEYTFNNFSSSQSLSSFDKIYITIKTNYSDPDVSTSIYNFNYVFNGYSFFNTSYKGTIYENFENLPLNFKFYLSSNNSNTSSKVYIDKTTLTSDVKIAGYSNTTQKQVSVVGNSVLGSIQADTTNLDSQNFLWTNVTNDNDTGILIYQDNGSSSISQLRLIFNQGLYISTDSLGNNDYYYIDKEGNLLIGNYEKPTIKEDTSYDISYYTSYITNYINDLSDSCDTLREYTQDFYDSMPFLLQAFIFTMFIFACLHIIFKLIERR